MINRFACTLLLVIVLGACAPAAQPSGESTPMVITAEVGTVLPETVNPFDTAEPFPTPGPPTPLPTLPASSFSPTELKYKVLDEFPDLFFCDPDFYPVAREDELVLAVQRFPELQSNQEEFQAILNHTGLDGASFTDDQKLLVYREHKRLNAVYFELLGDQYKFQIQTGLEGQAGFVITGTIAGNGSIAVQERTASFPACPICLAAGTWIDAPGGAIRVENVRVGDQVWTMNEAGVRVPGTVLQVGSMRVPVTHQIIHLVLRDGREMWASPGHPTADGRNLADLQVGEVLDGALVIRVERLPYTGTMTYDLLVAGDTSFYWANGILTGTTMNRGSDKGQVTPDAR